MIIITSAHVPFTRLRCAGSGWVSADLPKLVGRRP
jgi:hypothetical protein